MDLTLRKLIQSTTNKHRSTIMTHKTYRNSAIRGVHTIHFSCAIKQKHREVSPNYTLLNNTISLYFDICQRSHTNTAWRLDYHRSRFIWQRRKHINVTCAFHVHRCGVVKQRRGVESVAEVLKCTVYQTSLEVLSHWIHCVAF